jgi:adenylate cyclase class IV
MYEVEIKVEISNDEKEALLVQLKNKKFVAKDVTLQKDFYIEAKKSEQGGYDLKRCRQQGSEFIYTEKVWEMHGTVPARKEMERILSEAEFKDIVSKYPRAIQINKEREWFAGNYKGKEISFTVDTVKFDHSSKIRYFVEAEIPVEERERVAETKAFLEQFLKEILPRTKEIVESPGMFSMAFNKL